MNNSMIKILTIVSGMAVGLAAPGFAVADKVRAELSGFEEVPMSIFSDATGRFKAKIREGAGLIEYRLSFAGIESPVLFAHIHFGQRATNGGVLFWLCDNSGAGPTGTPACGQESNTVEGVLGAGDVVLDSQGIAPGELDKALEAIRAGATYVNLHSDDFPGGELRGQVRGGRQAEDDENGED